MGEKDLVCNFKKCKKILTEIAFITRCSHAFCEEDAIREIESQNAEKKCPACQSPLTQSYDLVKVVLNPSEQFKSMVLAGIRPELVMDIATRAIMFWIFQLQQENFNQKMISKSFRDSISQMKINFDVECGILKSKILDRERRIDELEKELENQNRKCAQMSVKLSEKCGEVQRWQMAYETIRREQISEIAVQRGNNLTEVHGNKPVPGNMGPQTMEELLSRHRGRDNVATHCQNVMGYDIRREEFSPRKSDERHKFYFQPQASPHRVSPKIFLDHDGCSRQTRATEFKR